LIALSTYCDVSDRRKERDLRGYIAVGLSTALLILLPSAGTVGVGYAAIRWATVEDADCGLWILPSLLITVLSALLGLAAGVGVGWLATLGVFRWANGCGLGDIRDDHFESVAV
jgi:hypothetical protein